MKPIFYTFLFVATSLNHYAYSMNPAKVFCVGKFKSVDYAILMGFARYHVKCSDSFELSQEKDFCYSQSCRNQIVDMANARLASKGYYFLEYQEVPMTRYRYFYSQNKDPLNREKPLHIFVSSQSKSTRNVPSGFEAIYYRNPITGKTASTSSDKSSNSYENVLDFLEHNQCNLLSHFEVESTPQSSETLFFADCL